MAIAHMRQYFQESGPEKLIIGQGLAVIGYKKILGSGSDPVTDRIIVTANMLFVLVGAVHWESKNWDTYTPAVIRATVLCAGACCTVESILTFDPTEQVGSFSDYLFAAGFLLNLAGSTLWAKYGLD